MDRPTESFEQFYVREYRSLLGLAYVITGSSASAEDVVQDAFTEAHRKWEDISTYDKPGAWVRRVMLNKHRSRLRRLRTEAKGLARLRSQTTPDIQPTERSLEVWAAVRALPRRQAEAMVLYYWSDFSVGEIAEILEISYETTKTHLKRGRSALEVSLDSFRPEQG